MTEKCIDVSVHNCRVPIDWPKVAASGVKGAVIRAGYGDSLTQQDKRFKDNITGAIAARLKVAVYWFSYADSVADALKEWAVCKQIIEPYRKNIKFVAFDYEYASYNYYKKVHGTAPTKELINAMANAFLNDVKSDRYGTALYTNNDYRLHIFTAATIAAWHIWLADYSGGPDIKCFMQQTGSMGHVPGISGNVDMDTLFEETKIADPPYTCDTSGTKEVERGKAYQALITCEKAPNITVGTPDVVTVLWRYDNGDDHYYYFVPIGQPGQEAGIYINGGPRQFIIKIK